MAKRKGSSSASRPRTRSKPAKEGSKAKTDHDKREVEDEFGQIRCEVRALQGKRIKLSERERKLEEQERVLQEQKRLLLREVEQVERNLLTRTTRLDENENSQRLDKLPQEVWGKILGNLKENDLFPLALSCRYFRQKQKELVARTRQSGRESGKPPLTLKTTLKTNLNLYCLDKRQPASAEYLRFCSKEKAPNNVGRKRDRCISLLAAYHGHLPVLQELLAGLKTDSFITGSAGESSSSFEFRF